MFCNKCGTQNPDGSNFCSSCGIAFPSYQQSPIDAPLYTIEIFRESQIFLVNPPINLTILWDGGEKKLSIANGQSIQLQFPEIFYTLTFSQSFRKCTVDVYLNRNVHIDLRWNRASGAIEAVLK